MEKSYYINANAVNDTKSFYFCITPTDGLTEISWVETSNQDAHVNLNLSYSFNKIDWVSYTKNSTITTSRPVYFRGNNTRFATAVGAHDSYAYIRLSLNKLCNLSGKISSLVRWFPSNRTEIVYGLNLLFYGNDYIKSIKNLELDVVLNGNAGSYPYLHNGNAGTYNKMFYGCDSLLDTPIILSNLEFPDSATIRGACMEMFKDCTSLVAIYELPNAMSQYIYREMFSGCTSLTTIPENLLPATTLSDYCYYAMFKDCTSLVNIPEDLLPATTLAANCYNQMFSGCSSLTTPPELPATTLASACYRAMFVSCINLETLPELPALTLSNECYYLMFNFCVKIKLSATQTGEYQTAYRVPILGTGTSGTDSLTGMFNNTGGTFTSAPSINTTYYTSNTVK